MKVETKTEFQFDYPMPKNFSPSISKPRHLAVLANNLLGLEWEEFDPGIGKYRASGNSQFLTTRMMLLQHGIRLILLRVGSSARNVYSNELREISPSSQKCRLQSYLRDS